MDDNQNRAGLLEWFKSAVKDDAVMTECAFP